ncbi:hypothetical protein GCM10007862_03770 [Dyella lipolytica]|nr:hypothetical protein GCM10007862_03770 [Dyella lipolytica]
MLTDHRLGHAQLPRGGGKRTGTHQRNEYGKPVEIDVALHARIIVNKIFTVNYLLIRLSDQYKARMLCTIDSPDGDRS